LEAPRYQIEKSSPKGVQNKDRHRAMNTDHGREANVR
jgi:hypothetical protein